MDITAVRIAVTLVALAAFLGIVYWAFAPQRRSLLNQAGRSILEDDR